MRNTLARIGTVSTLLLAGIVSVWGLPKIVLAATPSRLVYEGRLLDSTRHPIVTPVTLRFSLWKSADRVSGDASGGSINTSAANYGGWYETQTITPDSSGILSVQLGSGTTLPTIDFASHKYLQVEAKTFGAPDISYELLDPTGDSGSDTVDRQIIGSVPYAKEADTLNTRSVGTASGSLPVLGSGGLLAKSLVPLGTNQDSFTIDADNSQTTAISLTFGQALGKTLSFDIVNQYFNFNASVRIQGNLTVTGLINNVDITTLSGSIPLKVSSGAGLTARIQGGSYRVNGSITSFPGSGSVNLRNNTTNYLFFTSTGLTVVPGGFPTNKSFIPLSQVVTSGGTIRSVTDRRVLQSDDRESTVLKVLHPNFESASYQGDGTDNVGQLYVSHDNINLRNFYLWTSTRPTLQDYEVIVRMSLPAGFARWRDGITLSYRSTSSSTSNNKLEIQVYDTNGQPVTLSGSTTNLASTGWANTHIEFSGAPTWTAGQEFLVRLKLYAKDEYQMQVGDLKFDFVELSSP